MAKLSAQETEPELPQVEFIGEDEPRYLRRQKPVEIRRRKFGKQAWMFYAKVTLGVAAGVAGVWVAVQVWDFAMHSPRMVLADLEKIEVSGNQFVPRSAVLEKFTADQGRSTLRLPLAERRAALEEIPWVQRASVSRILPNGVRVELVERTPAAFLRMNTELALIDPHGVILERPLEGDFRFPVVTGISEVTPREQREKRMAALVQFLKEIELARPGAADNISEVELGEPADLRATLAGLPELGNAAADGQGSVLVHFGKDDFTNKFRVVIENIAQWRSGVGRLYSVDLRFKNQVVVNPETLAPAAARR